MNNQNAVYTLSNECHDCYRCIRECPVKAIKIENGHASVIPDKCIACGNCVKACPSNAKRVRVDIDKAKNLILAQKDVYVSLAPSWSGVFEHPPEKMIALLKTLGFKGVSETALGAQEVSIKTTQMLNEAEKGLFISSACPVIVDFIRHYHPEFIKNITPIGSPAMTHARMLKDKYGEDISIVFIGPCIGKKNEARDSGMYDVALTFEELKVWMNDQIPEKSAVPVDPTNKFVPNTAYEGSLYPIDGGMNETIRRIGIKKEVQLIDIAGLHSFENALKNLNPEKLEQVVFVEALSCEGGCVGGPCISTGKAGLSIISNVLNNVKNREVIPKAPSVVVPYSIQEKKVVSTPHSIEDILKTLKKIGKHTVDDELNCGGCGYATCRDLAKALLDGDAEASMCVSYMRKIAMRKAAALVRCMPAAVVMVDSSMNILEANDSFMRMFTGDMYEVFKSRPEGLAGAAIDRIVDFADLFKTILQSGKELHKERYAVKNRLYDISIFTIEENEIVGAVIMDVTQSETNREKISQKAHEVISKNISIVQEIACLLGEHMVETETLLSSIANDFDDKDENEAK
ncbi:TPA: 4Fe-4S dicluster domain-containing protein [Candidatus Scatousia excrementigallinarum]|uniref:4Fe-4S dicluster domain-containing protein n=1 Tax=Candidatus Scatousia excrementigallinarum TaxID=2840935 RepID=A0A9D1F096_9BACT|nr:4Fe-4S dicluster domain-containing protein [Candidatus Scatousia excrementigallinarum]